MTDDADNSSIARGAELFDKIGETKLRAVIADFYDRVFKDVMIGFMFQGPGIDKRHLVDREYELAAKFLGAPNITYTGRPMRTAHARHTIFGGHFERRLQILRETMRDHAVDPAVQQVWIDHTNALRSQITRDKGSECVGPSPEGGVTSSATPGLAIARPEPDPDRPVKLGRKP